MKTIIVEIARDGSVSLEDDHGSSSDIIEDLERSLGKVISKKQTCASKPNPTVQKIRQKNG